MSPARTRSARLSSTRRMMARRRGGAPYAGLKPSSTALLESPRDVQLDALGLSAADDVREHDVGDLLHLVLGQLAEDDDVVQAVEELGAEVLLEFLVDERLDAGV